MRPLAGRPWTLLLVLVAAALLVVGPAAGPGLAAPPVPPTPDLGRTIDPYQSWDSSEGTTCSSVVQPGVLVVRDLLKRTYPTNPSFGLLRTCSSTSRSGHEEGRALDWMVDARVPAQKALADAFIGWLLATDKYGNPHAMARRLGVMYLIYNNWAWRAYDPSNHANPSSNSHVDHIHLSFGWDGARALTSYFTGGYGCLPDTVGCPITRLAGADRYATSVAIARRAVPESRDVVIASGEEAHLVDGLVAAPFATSKAAPILLTRLTALPDVVASEVVRRGATRAFVLGGPGAVDPAVDAQLLGLGVTEVVRLAGANRFATAATIARATGTATGEVFVVSGVRDLVLALVAGGPAASQGIPVLLSLATDLTADTTAALADLGATKATVVGSSAHVSDATLARLPSPTRISGADVYATSTAVATAFRSRVGVTTAVLSSGASANTVDALPGGVLGRLMLLTAPTTLTPATQAWLDANQGVDLVTVLGGRGAVSDTAARQASLVVSAP